MKKAERKLLFNKTDIANMLGVTKGVLKYATEYAKSDIIDWKNRNQMLTDQQVYEVIGTVRTRLTPEEIDELIRNY